MEVTASDVSATANGMNYNLEALEREQAASLPDIKDFVKNTPHIPYILNGELYEIQTQDGENVTVRCCHCPPDRVYRGSVRSTGNFHMHIKVCICAFRQRRWLVTLNAHPQRRHPDLLGKLHDMKVNALIERRDRLIRGRKLPTRRIRNKTKCNQTTAASQDTGNVHTMHKLKIKTAYQRHQMQHQQQLQQRQRQQHQQLHNQQQQQHPKHQYEANRKWALPAFAVVPVDDTTPSTEQSEPLNYSIKSDNLKPIMDDSVIPTAEDHHEGKQQAQQPLLSLAEVIQPINGHAINCDYFSDITSCASTVSSYVSSTSAGNNQRTSISVIKDELLMPERAIDLTVNNSSLSLSSGLGTDATTTSTAERLLESHSAAGSLSPKSKQNDLLQQTDLYLREIRREIRTRNQIESNRLYLEIAKFKFLHPGFNFEF